MWRWLVIFVVIGVGLWMGAHMSSTFTLVVL